MAEKSSSNLATGRPLRERVRQGRIVREKGRKSVKENVKDSKRERERERETETETETDRERESERERQRE
jgi:hypothetical protein